MTSSGGEDKTGAHEALGAGIDSTSHNGDARAVALRGDLYRVPAIHPGARRRHDDVRHTLRCGCVRALGPREVHVHELGPRARARLGFEDRDLHYSPWRYRLNDFDDVRLSLLTEVASGEGVFAESVKGAVVRANRLRTARRVAAAIADATRSGAGNAIKDGPTSTESLSKPRHCLMPPQKRISRGILAAESASTSTTWIAASP